MCHVKEFPSKYENVLRCIAENEKIVSYTVHTLPNSIVGNNFYGDIYEVDIKGKTENEDKELNLFIKINYKSDDLTVMSVDGIFKRELFVYKELFDVFAKLQENANIPLSERFKTVKFYGDSTSDIIILENVVKKGFKPFHNKGIVSLDFAEISLKELAKLHALSFALEEKIPEYFNTKIKTLKTNLTLGDEWVKHIKNVTDYAMKYVDNAIVEKVTNAYYKSAERFAWYFNDVATRRCLCHGDYKAGNMMMKINENGQVTDIIPTDYQLVHYGCPVLDLIFFIFMNTDKRFRNDHLAHLKKVYHDYLRTFLEYFDMDVELVYPRKMFDEVYREKIDFALAIYIGVLQPMLEDNVTDGSNYGLLGASIEISDAFIKMQRDVIEEFIECGYIV